GVGRAFQPDPVRSGPIRTESGWKARPTRIGPDGVGLDGVGLDGPIDADRTDISPGNRPRLRLKRLSRTGTHSFQIPQRPERSSAPTTDHPMPPNPDRSCARAPAGWPVGRRLLG